MNDRKLYLATRHRIIIVDVKDIIEAGIFIGITVAVYLLTGLALRWAGVS